MGTFGFTPINKIFKHFIRDDVFVPTKQKEALLAPKITAKYKVLFFKLETSLARPAASKSGLLN